MKYSSNLFRIKKENKRDFERYFLDSPFSIKVTKSGAYKIYANDKDIDEIAVNSFLNVIGNYLDPNARCILKIINEEEFKAEAYIVSNKKIKWYDCFGYCLDTEEGIKIFK